ncbi:MAG: ATP-binding protein [Rubrivivax sp.]|nr:ATP-binding protein [Rubrivivax sp.]
MNATHRLEVRPHLDDLGQVRDFIEASAAAHAMPADRVGELVLAVDEWVSNLIEHGGLTEAARIEIEVVRGPDAIRVRIRDPGDPFDPTRHDDRDLDLSPLEHEKPGGFGLALLRRLVDGVSYRLAEDGCNELVLAKRL